MVGNIAVERLNLCCKNKEMPNLLAKDLKSSVKLVVGTCVSLGVLS
jgi:ribosomal protein L11